MATPSAQQYKEIGESMGLSGAELVEYVTASSKQLTVLKDEQRERLEKETKKERHKQRKKNVNIEKRK